MKDILGLEAGVDFVVQASHFHLLVPCVLEQVLRLPILVQKLISFVLHYLCSMSQALDVLQALLHAIVFDLILLIL